MADKEKDNSPDIPVVFEVTKDDLMQAVRTAINLDGDGKRTIMSMSTDEFAAFFLDLQKAKQYLQAKMENDTMEKVLADVEGLGKVAAATLPFRITRAEDVDKLARDLKEVLKGPNPPELAIIVAQVSGGKYA